MAAEWPIYGRFGYSPAAWRSRFTLDPRRPGARVPASPDAVRQVDLDEFLQHARGVFTRSAAQRAGNIDRPDAHWQISFGTPEKPAHRDYVYVLAEAAGQVDGYLIWKAGGHQDYGDDGIVEIVELLAASGDAYRALWGYVLNMDLVAELRVARRPVDEPLRWLLGDGRVLNPVAQKDAQWVRLLDVPAALSARRYSVPDRLVIEVVDDASGGYAAGRFVLDGGPDGASCRPTDRSPNLRLHQHSLASAYYGGVTLASQQLARPVDEETPGAAARLDAMLTTRLAPWPFTDF
jgi:predicted acetyltransferase